MTASIHPKQCCVIKVNIPGLRLFSTEDLVGRWLESEPGFRVHSHNSLTDKKSFTKDVYMKQSILFHIRIYFGSLKFFCMLKRVHIRTALKNLGTDF